jgi:hypothetical protein
MASESRQKTFHYKRAQFVGISPLSLSDLLLAAHQKEKRPMKRAQRFGEGEKKWRLINQCYARGAMVVGCLLDFTEGNFQPMVNLDEEQFELAISQLAPGAKQQILEGMLFFGVEGDHVVLLQSSGLRSAEFEKHINWWLIERTQVLSADAFVSLDNEPDRKVADKLAGVKSVTLRAPAILQNLPAGEDMAEQQSLTGVLKARIWELLQTAGAFEDGADATAAMATEEVDLSIEIRRRGRGTKGPTILDGLAHTLRHSEDDVFELETSAGIVRGNELRLTRQKSVKTLNGVPDLTDVAEKMQDCLAQLKSEGQLGEE